MKTFSRLGTVTVDSVDLTLFFINEQYDLESRNWHFFLIFTAWGPTFFSVDRYWATDHSLGNAVLKLQSSKSYQLFFLGIHSLTFCSSLRHRDRPADRKNNAWKRFFFMYQIFLNTNKQKKKKNLVNSILRPAHPVIFACLAYRVM